jgi:hypothetical protein
VAPWLQILFSPHTPLGESLASLGPFTVPEQAPSPADPGAGIGPLTDSWPRCKVAGCPNEAALGGACAELHGGASPTSGGYVLFERWPGEGDDPDEVELCEPPLGEWQCWCVSRRVWDRWAVDGAWPRTPEPGSRGRRRERLPRFATLGGLGAPQLLRARAARALIRAGRVSLIALRDQMETANRFFPGLCAAHADVRSAALPLVFLSDPFDAPALTLVAASVEGRCLAAEACRRLLGQPVWKREPLPLPLPVAGGATEPEAEPEPRRRPRRSSRPHRRSPRAPSGRWSIRLDAYRQHPEWPLPPALIDTNAEDRLIALCDARRAVEG